MCGGLDSLQIDYYSLYERYFAPKGIAMLTLDMPSIGLQRNGPIGTVRLTFNGQWSRFDNYAGPQYDDE